MIKFHRPNDWKHDFHCDVTSLMTLIIIRTLYTWLEVNPYELDVTKHPCSTHGKGDRLCRNCRTCAISAHQPFSCEFESSHNEAHIIQHYVILLVSDFQQIVFPPVSSPNKTVGQDMAKMSLKVALNTIPLNPKHGKYSFSFSLNMILYYFRFQ